MLLNKGVCETHHTYGVPEYLFQLPLEKIIVFKKLLKLMYNVILMPSELSLQEAILAFKLSSDISYLTGMDYLIVYFLFPRLNEPTCLNQLMIIWEVIIHVPENSRSVLQ
jgi:hypothetical protein